MLKRLVAPPKGDSKVKPVYHLYVIKAKKRDELREYLQKKGVCCGVCRGLVWGSLSVAYSFAASLQATVQV